LEKSSGVFSVDRILLKILCKRSIISSPPALITSTAISSAPGALLHFVFWMVVFYFFPCDVLDNLAMGFHRQFIVCISIMFEGGVKVFFEMLLPQQQDLFMLEKLGIIIIFDKPITIFFFGFSSSSFIVFNKLWLSCLRYCSSKA